MATIAEQYFIDTTETVAEACKSMHANGISIERASQIIGYASSSDMRKYLRRRNLVCPWPTTQSDKRRGKPPYKIKDAAMEKYVELRTAGVTAKEAAKKVGHDPDQLRVAIHTRRKDLSLPRGAHKGPNCGYRRAGARRQISDATLEKYVELLNANKSSRAAGRELGHDASTLNRAVLSRRKDLKLPSAQRKE